MQQDGAGPIVPWKSIYRWWWTNQGQRELLSKEYNAAAWGLGLQNRLYTHPMLMYDALSVIELDL